MQAVVAELQGEKIDIIQWSPDEATFIVNALAPAEVSKVVMDEEDERVEVVVPDEQLSLAIGRRGQNVRLASQLTGWQIDIMTESQESERRQREFAERTALFQEALDVDEVIAQLLVTEGFATVEDVAYVDADEIAAIEGFDEDTAEEIQARARDFLDKEAAELDAKRNELGVEDGLLEIEGVTLPMAVALGEGDVKTVEDLAGLVPDDLRGWFESKNGERVREPGILESLQPGRPSRRRGADHARPRRHGLGRGPAEPEPEEELGRPRLIAEDGRGRSHGRAERRAEAPEVGRADPPGTSPAEDPRPGRPRTAGHRLRRGDGRGAADPLRRRRRTAWWFPTWRASCPAAACGWRPTGTRWRPAAQEEPLRPLGQGQAGRARRPGRSGRTACCAGGFSTAWGLRGGPATLSRGSKRFAAAIAAGKAAWLIEASRRRRRRPAQAAAARPGKPQAAPRCSALFTSDELGLALGRRECDTHRLPCGARRRALDGGCPSDWPAFVRSFLRVGARSLEAERGACARFRRSSSCDGLS